MIPLVAIAKTLLTVAPSIANWIGGDKAENAAQFVIDVARQSTGQNDAQQATEMILKDENLKFKFLALLEQNRNQLDELYLKGRENARNMYSKHNEQADRVAERVMRFNIWFVLVMVGMNIAVVHFMREHTELVAIASNIIGIAMRDLLAERHSVTAFYFGSSLGSKNKK